jgi:hypothetical protein
MLKYEVNYYPANPYDNESLPFKEYFSYGEYHRTCGPAMITSGGVYIYFRDGSFQHTMDMRFDPPEIFWEF